MTKEEIQKNSEHWYNLYKQAEKQLEEIKANADYQIEGRDLEIKTLGERCNQLLKDKGDLTDKVKKLEKENAEWEKFVKDIQNRNEENYLNVCHKLATELNRGIELEQQIEKMKSIYNCVNGGFGCRLKNGEPCCVSYTGCDMWQLKE